VKLQHTAANWPLVRDQFSQRAPRVLFRVVFLAYGLSSPASLVLRADEVIE
jgi:hypothetical protein